jgi:hypothetical protein
MLIEVTEKHPAAPGKKVATVVAAGGAKFDIWPEQLAAIQVGGRYEVEVSDREYNGRTYRKITKATPYGSSDGGVTAAARARTGNGNGNGASYYKPTSPQDSERMFTCSLLNAFIRAGRIEPNEDQITKAIEVLRRAYRRTFGAAE